MLCIIFYPNEGRFLNLKSDREWIPFDDAEYGHLIFSSYNISFQLEHNKNILKIWESILLQSKYMYSNIFWSGLLVKKQKWWEVVEWCVSPNCSRHYSRVMWDKEQKKHTHWIYLEQKKHFDTYQITQGGVEFFFETCLIWYNITGPLLAH